MKILGVLSCFYYEEVVATPQPFRLQRTDLPNDVSNLVLTLLPLFAVIFICEWGRNTDLYFLKGFVDGGNLVLLV